MNMTPALHDYLNDMRMEPQIVEEYGKRITFTMAVEILFNYGIKYRNLLDAGYQLPTE